MPLPSVIFASSFVPPEWIEAHGLRPSRVAPRAAGAVEREGLCPFAGAFAAAADGPDVAAAVFTTTCDQMRRAAEIGGDGGRAERFVMHVPSTWQTPAAHRLYREELGRLGRFLVRLGGHGPAPGELAACMERREAMRDEVLARRPRLTSRAHGDLAMRFHETGVLPPASDTVPASGGSPLMLLGGPMRREDLGLFDTIDRSGGCVAVDGTESGEREWPRRFDRRRMGGDPAGELADAYFGHIPAVFRRPDSGLFDWLAAALRATPVRGIVVVTHPWCDAWRAEVPRIRDASPVPVLALDLAGAGASAGEGSTRVEAFLEALR
ncbi:MAG: 2-hydroxyacyl-CoA dehydratase [Lentisphaerae bacterium]|nr:2-hydroxyacyl-CoA dehydratase [Lentisphaerota bacterium]